MTEVITSANALRQGGKKQMNAEAISKEKTSRIYVRATKVKEQLV